MRFAVAASGHVLQDSLAHTTQTSVPPKLLTYMQQTVSIVKLEHLHRYATSLLGVCLCLGGAQIDT